MCLAPDSRPSNDRHLYLISLLCGHAFFVAEIECACVRACVRSVFYLFVQPICVTTVDVS